VKFAGRTPRALIQLSLFETSGVPESSNVELYTEHACGRFVTAVTISAGFGTAPEPAIPPRPVGLCLVSGFEARARFMFSNLVVSLALSSTLRVQVCGNNTMRRVPEWLVVLVNSRVGQSPPNPAARAEVQGPGVAFATKPGRLTGVEYNRGCARQKASVQQIKDPYTLAFPLSTPRTGGCVQGHRRCIVWARVRGSCGPNVGRELSRVNQVSTFDDSGELLGTYPTGRAPLGYVCWGFCVSLFCLNSIGVFSGTVDKGSEWSNHPCRSLVSWMTLEDSFGRSLGRSRPKTLHGLLVWYQ